MSILWSEVCACGCGKIPQTVRGEHIDRAGKALHFYQDPGDPDRHRRDYFRRTGEKPHEDKYLAGYCFSTLD